MMVILLTTIGFKKLIKLSGGYKVMNTIKFLAFTFMTILLIQFVLAALLT